MKGLGPDVKLFFVKGGFLQELPAKINEAVATVELVQSTAGASVLNIKVIDPERVLSKTGYFKKIEVEPNRKGKKLPPPNQKWATSEAILFDEAEDREGWAFETCAFQKTSDEYQLKLEDRDVGILREHTGHKVAHASETGAQFIERLVRKAAPHIKFTGPRDPGHKEPLEGKKPKKAKAKAKAPAAGTSITVKGQPPDADQRKNIGILKEVCQALSAPPTAEVAMFMAAIQESDLHTSDPSDHGSDGVFQLTDETAASTGLSKSDTKGTAEHWLTDGYFGKGGGIKLAQEGKKAAEIAQDVEGSAHPEDYEQWKAEAEAIVKATGGASASSSSATPELKPKIWEQEAEEGVWECAIRIAGELGYFCFMRYGEMVFKNGLELADEGKLTAISEDTPGIVEIDWELDRSEKKNPPNVTIDARAEFWEFPPGAPIELVEPVDEPAVGLWIVEEITRKDTTDNAVTIKLAKPEKPKATPSESVTPAAVAKAAVTTGAAPGTPTTKEPSLRQNEPSGNLKTNSSVTKLWEQLVWIAAQDFPYVFGGGHGFFGATTAGGNPRPNNHVELKGLDCSGAQSWALHTAGLFNFPDPIDSGEFSLQWGEPGKGRYFTIWANGEHVFMELSEEMLAAVGSAETKDGNPHQFWSAKHPGTIVGFASSEEPTSNFIARHWPGL